jgi:hypothetical protein
MKSLLSMLLALSMAISPSLACANNMPKPVMTTTHRIEMTIVTSTGDGPVKRRDICSSTAIGPHALLTATHCDLGASTVNVDGTEAAIMARLTDDSDHTIYMLNITFGDYAKFGKAVKVGDEVWLRGNPDGMNQLVRYGHFSGPIVIDDEKTSRKVGVLLFDINGWQGDSGSAIFDKHGKIVAVTSVGFTDGAFALLGTYALRFTPAQMKQAATTSMNFTMVPTTK